MKPLSPHHLYWRCKESLDLIGDVLMAGELPDQELRRLHESLCRLLDRHEVSKWLTPGRRGIAARAIVAEFKRAETKERIAELRKGDVYA